MSILNNPNICSQCRLIAFFAGLVQFTIKEKHDKWLKHSFAIWYYSAIFSFINSIFKAKI